MTSHDTCVTPQGVDVDDRHTTSKVHGQLELAHTCSLASKHGETYISFCRCKFRFQMRGSFHFSIQRAPLITSHAITNSVQDKFPPNLFIMDIHKDNVWVFCGLNVWFIIYLSHCWALCNFMLQWASYQIRKIASCACAGNVGNVFPATDFKGNR